MPALAADRRGGGRSQGLKIPANQAAADTEGRSNITAVSQKAEQGRNKPNQAGSAWQAKRS
jgi:hypothetical protein